MYLLSIIIDDRYAYRMNWLLDRFLMLLHRDTRGSRKDHFSSLSAMIHVERYLQLNRIALIDDSSVALIRSFEVGYCLHDSMHVCRLTRLDDHDRPVHTIKLSE